MDEEKAAARTEDGDNVECSAPDVSQSISSDCTRSTAQVEHSVLFGAQSSFPVLQLAHNYTVGPKIDIEVDRSRNRVGHVGHLSSWGVWRLVGSCTPPRRAADGWQRA